MRIGAKGCVVLLSICAACGGRSLSTDNGVELDVPPRDVSIPADYDPVFCRPGVECGSWEYCARVVGDCEGTAQCLDRPTACPEHCPGVCGCDGQTYCSVCEANSAGVSLVFEAPCEMPEECWSNEDCGTNRYCDLPGCHGPGVCTPRPADCLGEINAACGCDGQTYANTCEAARHGVSVRHPSVCEVCYDLQEQYALVLAEARQCCPFCDSLQCTVTVPDRLVCGCKTFVEPYNAGALVSLEELRDTWHASGCDYMPPCPPFACPDPTGSVCTPSSNDPDVGSCEDVYD